MNRALPRPSASIRPRGTSGLVHLSRTCLGLGLAALVALGGSSCSSGLPDSNSGSSPTLNPTNNLSLGFNPGIDLTGADAQITEKSVVGARLPMPDGSSLEVIFTAFATAAPADDVGGQGPLVKGSNPPSDDNDTSDVFVAAVVNAGITFEQAFVETFRHPRCINCHGFNSAASPTIPAHTGGRSGDCSVCHTDGAAGIANVQWEAPPAELDFRNKTVEELCEQVKDFEGDVSEHMKGDEKIDWSISSGQVPDNGPGPTTLPVAPISKGEWDRRVDEWVQGGMICDSSGAVKDIKLVSQVGSGAASRTGNGPSFSPTLTYLPIQDPILPVDKGVAVDTLVGILLVAYATDASDLTAGDTNGATDIYRQSYDVLVDRDADGNFEAGGVHLRRSGLTLISQRSGLRANGASSRPDIGETGSFIAFESLATNLVVGFQDANGADEPDVFLSRAGSGLNTLLSHDVANPVRGGDGPSHRPVLGSGGMVVAWESGASNLVTGDGNDVQDIFWTRFDGNGAKSATSRASVRTGGQEGTAGACRNADIHALNVTGTEALIVYESDKTDLIAPLAVSAIPSVYLHDSRTGGLTTLISQARPGAAPGVPGNGGSRFPQLSPLGNAIAYETLASNVDTVRPNDGNGVSDVVLVDLNPLFTSGQVRGRRLSISGNGADGNGPSRRPLLARFLAPDSLCDSTLFAAYLTAATNVGGSENSNSVILLLDEDELPASGPSCQIVVDREVADPGEDFSFDGGESTSTVAITNYQWEFGDGNFGSGENVQHAYDTPGTYEVTLRVTDASGGCSSCVTSVRVNARPTCQVTSDREVAQFEGDPVTFRFDASESSDPDGEIVSYTWELDRNGSPVTTTVPQVDFEIDTPGDHFVLVTVTDDDGTSSVGTCAAVVRLNSPPVCEFEVTAQDGVLFTNENATFDASASSDAESSNANLTFEWDFGDGTSATGMVVQHAYDRRGVGEDFTVTVTLTVSDPNGGVSTCSAPVDVTFQPNQGPDIEIAINGTSIPDQNPPDITGLYVNQTITIDATATTDPDGDDADLTFDWDILDAGGNELTPQLLNPQGSLITIETSVHGIGQLTLMVTDVPPAGEAAASSDRNLELPIGARFLSVNEIVQGCGSTARSCHLFIAPGFSQSPSVTYNSLLNQMASCSNVGINPATRVMVDPAGGDAGLNNSTLWLMTNPATNATLINCTSRGSMDITDPDRLSIIESWIRAGAANN